jgi:hypothetical protein
MQIKTQVKVLWWWKTIFTTKIMDTNLSAITTEKELVFADRFMAHKISAYFSALNFGFFLNIKNPKPELLVITRQDNKVRIIIITEKQLIEKFISKLNFILDIAL